jgi:hypothetical protein
MPRTPTPAEIRAAILTTAEAAELLGLERKSTLDLLYRRHVVPLIEGKAHLWYRPDVEAVARGPRHNAGPPRKRAHSDPS